MKDFKNLEECKRWVNRITPFAVLSEKASNRVSKYTQPFRSESARKKVINSIAKSLMTRQFNEFDDFYVEEKKMKDVKIDQIIDIIEKHKNINIRDRSRKRHITKYKQLACYFIREYKGKKITNENIGSYFGNIKASSVLNSVRVTKNDIETNKEFRKEVRYLKSKIDAL